MKLMSEFVDSSTGWHKKDICGNKLMHKPDNLKMVISPPPLLTCDSEKRFKKFKFLKRTPLKSFIF